MLPTSYKNALLALKDQAHAATSSLLDSTSGTNAADLADAQRRMCEYPDEIKVISRLLLTSKDDSLTIDSLDDARLAHELGIR